jgi:hypothetical protein
MRFLGDALARDLVTSESLRDCRVLGVAGKNLIICVSAQSQLPHTPGCILTLLHKNSASPPSLR